ncbi:MAG: hypothetical protein KatS3mg129_1764 [Leptospiraceae bacterium]|nr:MAG: hypothetical protein KatS3mg129_1764 [Leptospiraceae bacterium]
MNLVELKEKIRKVFTPEQAEVLEEYANVLNDLVKVSDFNELKQIVKELAEAQKQTAQEIKELAEAQKQTEH